MYISLEQLRVSHDKLDAIHPFFGTSFLAFKALNLPIGEPISVDIANAETVILDNYYNPYPESQYYYVPLRGNGPKSRWVSKQKYPSSGLQRTRTGTLKEAFLHPTSTTWAWSPNYLLFLTTWLKQFKVTKIPVFHLAIWIFRDVNWENTTQPEDIRDKFLTEFKISDEEKRVLFDLTIDTSLPFDPLLRFDAISERTIRTLIKIPKDISPDEDGGLESIALVGVGPAKDIKFNFADRLNIITGDNGLGKTFLLDCAWWALTGRWADIDQPVRPRQDSRQSSISFSISSKFSESKTINFDRITQTWPQNNISRSILPGIVIYAQVDGSFLIWDPARHYWSIDNDGTRRMGAIELNEKQIWDGSSIEQKEWIKAGNLQWLN